MGSKLFDFTRKLPEPFDKLSNKKVKVSSVYGDGTIATLTSTVVKAVIAFCKCKNGDGLGAVGRNTTRLVAEYKSAMGPDAYHIVVYDTLTGMVMASCYDKNTELIESYLINRSQKDGSAVLMALIPLLLEDDEFKTNFVEFFNHYLDNYSDFEAAKNCMAIMCDNAYRRISDETCKCHIKVNIDNSGNTTRVSQTHLDSGTFIPDEVIVGNFSIFSNTNTVDILKPVKIVEHSDFIGKYVLNSSRVLTKHQQSLIPQIEPWYIIPPEVENICKHAMISTNKQTPMRNFLLRGPAGTGKTAGAKAIAAGLGLPYVKYTCSANTEIFDFIGQIFPDTDGQSTGNAELDKERSILQEMGGINYENVAKLMNLPDLDDMDYDPAGVYKVLSGVENENATSQNCMELVLTLITDKIRSLCTPQNEQKSGQIYTYVETDFIKALKYGYVCEIQEPSTIMQPGVLVGLNSLLEQQGTITLPTGEVIRRHPDTIIIVTTNISYEGCRALNQSVVDRMNLVQDIEMPPPEVMAQRAMSITGFEDDYVVSKMVKVVNDISDYCRKNGITDGSCGMRSLIDWIISTEITENPYVSALHTIISKAATEEDDRLALVTSVLDTMFVPK